MKNVLSVVVAALVVLGAIPALAADGNVPGATLSALGLSGMQEVSDAEGMQVRGMSAKTYASGRSMVVAWLVDPKTNNWEAGFDTNGANAKGGKKAKIRHGSSVDLSLKVTQPKKFKAFAWGYAGQAADKKAGMAVAKVKKCRRRSK